MLSTKSYQLFNVQKNYAKTLSLALRARPWPQVNPNQVRCVSDKTGSAGRRDPVKVSFVDDEPRLTHVERLKRVVQNYGTTAVVLHIVYSLTSLGMFYCLIYFGVDIPSYIDLNRFGDTAAKVMAGSGTFAVAYALHKMIMPARIGLTIVTTPYVVSKLRRFGIIKKPHKHI